MPRRDSTALIEALECRALLSATAVARVDDSVLAYAYEPTRHTLYMTTRRGVIHRFDAGTGVALDRWTVGTTLHGMDVTPDGDTLYVADESGAQGGGRLHKVDLDTGNVTTLNLGPALASVADVAVLADGTTFVAATNGGIQRIDPGTGATIPTAVLPVGSSDLLRSADRSTLRVAPRTLGATLSLYDLAAGAFTIEPNAGPGAGPISADGSFVATRSAVLDASLGLVALLPPNEAAGAFDPVRPLLYTFNATTQRVSAFDTTTWAKQFDFDPGFTFTQTGTLMDVAPDGSRLFLSGGGGVVTHALVPHPHVGGLPEHVRPGVPYEMTVSFHGHGDEPVAWSGTLQFSSEDPAASLPADAPLTLAADETATFTVTFATAGKRTVAVSDAANHLSGTTKTVIDATAPTAKLTGGSAAPSWEPGGPFRVYARLADDVGLDPASIDDPAPELIAVGPDGTEYGLQYGIIDTPDPPGLMCSGDCAKRRDNYGFYPPATGTYVIRLADGAARDLAGNPSLRTDLGTVRYVSTPSGRRGYDVYKGHDLAASLEAVPPQAGGKPLVTGAIVLTNPGDLPAKGVSRVTVSVVPADGSAPPRELLAWDQRVSLAPERSRKLKLRAEVPADLPEGQYRLVVYAGPFGGVERVEASDGNNTATSEPFALRPVSTGRPANVAGLPPEESVYLNSYDKVASMAARLYNGGDAPARGRYVITLFATADPASNNADAIARGEVVLGTFTKAVKLQPGETRLLPLRFPLPEDLPFTRYFITAKVSPA